MNQFLKPKRLILAASAILAALGTAAGLTPFIVVYLLADEALIGDLTTDRVIDLSMIACAGILAKVLLATSASAVSHRVAYQILYDIRRALVDKLSRTQLGYFTVRPAGELKKVINEDVEQLEEVLAHAIPDIFAALAIPISCAVALAFVDWRLALAAVVMFPILVVVYPVTLISTKSMSERYYAALAALRNTTVEFLQGMKVIRAFLAADHVPGRFAEAVNELAEATRAMSNAALVPGALMMVGLRANILVLLPVGGMLLVGGEIDTGTFVLFLLMGMGVNASAYKLLLTAGTFGMRVATAGKQIAEILAQPEPEEPARPKRPLTFEIAFKDVGFRYEGGSGVQNISFDAPQGSFTGIVGPSGAGKTTLARLIGRFWEAESGSITIGGVELREIGHLGLMDHISFILQDAWLLNTSIRENIRLGRPEATDAEVALAAERARVMEFAVDLDGGLDGSVGEGGRLLSGGQRQRVAIARAILRDTPIVVMDEATSALDPDTEQQVLEALAELGRGRTVIAIAHRLNTLRGADRILYMEDGTIAADGPHEDLLETSEGYAKLCACFEASGGWRLEKTDRTMEIEAVPQGVTVDAPVEDWQLQTGKGAWTLFFSLLGPHRRQWIRHALPLLFLEGLFMGAPVIAVMLTLLDLQAGTLTMSAVWTYTGLVAASLVLQGLFNILGNRVLWRVQTGAAARLQHRLGDHLRHTPLGVLQERDTGKLETLITQHVTELNFVTPTTQMMRALVAPLVSLVLLISLDWRLALAVVGTIPLFLAVVRLSDGIYQKVWRDLIGSRERINGALLEFLQGMPTLRALGLGADRLPEVGGALSHHRDVSLGTVTRVAPLVTVGLAMLDLSFCLILLAGGLLVVSGSLSLPMLLVFLVIGLVFYGPIGDAFELAAYRRQQERSMQRVADVLALPVLPEPGNPSVPTSADVRFENVSFAYGDKPALTDVSMDLTAGGLHAFVGRSGSGKSTALNLLARFWDVNSGKIKVGGVDLRDLSRDQRARLFAVVFQDTFLFNDTIANNLRLARPGVGDEEMIAAAKAARCHDFISALEDGYDSPVGEGGAKLSGGQRQRLAIARAILKDAPIVLLDEATASVDPESEFDIRVALAALCAGRTVIVVAHRLSSITEADQIVLFDRGRVLDQGTFDQLKERTPAFQKLLGAAVNAAQAAE